MPDGTNTMEGTATVESLTPASSPTATDGKLRIKLELPDREAAVNFTASVLREIQNTEPSPEQAAQIRASIRQHSADLIAEWLVMLASGALAAGCTPGTAVSRACESLAEVEKRANNLLA